MPGDIRVFTGSLITIQSEWKFGWLKKPRSKNDKSVRGFNIEKPFKENGEKEEAHGCFRAVTKHFIAFFVKVWVSDTM